jgi:hypothetical protein
MNTLQTESKKLKIEAKKAEKPAKSSQSSIDNATKKRIGPMSALETANRLARYDKLEKGLNDRDLIKSFIHAAEQDVLVGEFDYLNLGRMYSQFKAMNSDVQFTFIRAIAAERKLTTIPAKANFIGLATVLYPPFLADGITSNPKWADAWKASGTTTLIQKRMSKCLANYVKFEEARLAAIEGEKAIAQHTATLAKAKAELAEAIAVADARLASGEITPVEHGQLVTELTANHEAFVNPKMVPVVKIPAKAHELYVRLSKLAVEPRINGVTRSDLTETFAQFLRESFHAFGYAMDDLSKWEVEARS